MPKIYWKSHYKSLVRLDFFEIFHRNAVAHKRIFFLFYSENEVFQFFVRASDRGTPPMHADVSVDVYIMSSKDVPPVFETNENKVFVPEEAAIGAPVYHRQKLIKYSSILIFLFYYR